MAISSMLCLKAILAHVLAHATPLLDFGRKTLFLGFTTWYFFCFCFYQDVQVYILDRPMKALVKPSKEEKKSP